MLHGSHTRVPARAQIVPAGSTWVHKHKDAGQMSAAASLGMIMQWNIDELSSNDKHMHAPEEHIKAGGVRRRRARPAG